MIKLGKPNVDFLLQDPIVKYNFIDLYNQYVETYNKSKNKFFIRGYYIHK